MAVLWQSSFDFLATADMAVLGRVSVGSPPTIASTGGAVASYAETASGSGWWVSLPETPASVWVHFRFYWTGAAATLVVFGDGSYTQCGFVIESAGIIQAYRAGNGAGVTRPWEFTTSGTLLGTGTTLLKANCWHSFQAEVTLSDTVGVMKTWINGGPDLNLTAQDTKQSSGVAEVHQVGFGVYGTSIRYDDLVIGDTTSPNTGHPGDVRVDCMKPDANGTDSDFTLSVGTDDYAVLDEAATDPTDYAYTTTVGHRISVSVTALTNAGGTIVAASATAYASKNETGPCGFKIYCRSGGTRYYSEEFFPSYASWAYYHMVWDVDPDTGVAWTESGFNSAEFGVERTT